MGLPIEKHFIDQTVQLIKLLFCLILFYYFLKKIKDTENGQG